MDTSVADALQEQLDRQKELVRTLREDLKEQKEAYKAREQADEAAAKLSANEASSIVDHRCTMAFIGVYTFDFWSWQASAAKKEINQLSQEVALLQAAASKVCL